MTCVDAFSNAKTFRASRDMTRNVARSDKRGSASNSPPRLSSLRSGRRIGAQLERGAVYFSSRRADDFMEKKRRVANSRSASAIVRIKGFLSKATIARKRPTATIKRNIPALQNVFSSYATRAAQWLDAARPV